MHFLQVHNDPDRPLERRNPRSEEIGDLVPMDWDDAVREIAAELGGQPVRCGRNALAVQQGNPSAFKGSSGPETGEVLLITPDTDFYFLAAILTEIVFRIGYNRTAVDKHARNIAWRPG